MRNHTSYESNAVSRDAVLGIKLFRHIFTKLQVHSHVYVYSIMFSSGNSLFNFENCASIQTIAKDMGLIYSASAAYSVLHGIESIFTPLRPPPKPYTQGLRFH